MQMLGVLLLLLAALACVLPGQAVQPMPTLVPGGVETAIFSTAHAAETQTAQVVAVTTTAFPAPSESPTPIPRISSSGTSLVNLADGSTQLLDYTAGIQMVFPSGLLVFRVGEPEYYAAWEKNEMQNPELRDVFSALSNLDPKNLRVVALDLRPDRMPNGIMTALNLIYLPGDTTSLKEWEQVRKSRGRPCVGYKFIASNLVQTANGTQVLIVEERCSAESNKGTIYERAVYFTLPTGTMHLDLETNLDYKDSALAEFDQVVNSISPFTP